jgi:hypothetical protein
VAKARPSDTSGQKLWALDNGRVLGYDNNHGHHHRHFMGRIESVLFVDNESLAARFYEEVRDLWRQEDERNNQPLHS